MSEDLARANVKKLRQSERAKGTKRKALITLGDRDPTRHRPTRLGPTLFNRFSVSGGTVSGIGSLANSRSSSSR